MNTTPRKIVQVEDIELGEYNLLQLTLYSDDNVEVRIMKDNGNDVPQSDAVLDVPKRLFFGAALRLLEEDNK